MKICQENNYKKQIILKKNKTIKNVLIFAFFLFLTLFSLPKDVFAIFASPNNEADCVAWTGGGGPTTISVWDEGTCKKVEKSSWQGMMQSIKNWLAEKELWKGRWDDDTAAAMAYKSALRYFLNTLAVDTATYLASGDSGQKPMFFTEDMGAYIKNVGDNAAGTFLETLGRESPLKFNLCQPNLAVNLKINLGLFQGQKPPQPQCTFSKMKENWEKELQDPNFLNNFQDMFNPWSNDLGIALSLQTGIETQKSAQINQAIKDYEVGQGFKPFSDPINKMIKTPAALIKEAAGLPLKEAASLEKARTGNIVADAIDIFVNTLAGKLMDNWLKKGLVTDFEDNSYDWDKLSLDGSGTSGGAAGAKERFKKIIQPEFGIRGDYNILAELTQCPNPNKAGPTNCVITENFRQAVANKLTVGEAMRQGYLNANGIFGFTVDGLEPPYNEGYPYRAMIILRKFRILPVGWEIAAQYIKANPSLVDGTKNLSDLVNCFDPDDDYEGYEQTWCAGLVDPNWVLKAPLNYCKREGPGPEITNEQIVGSGDDSELNISRKDNYCGDEQSCIKEKDDGSCQLYGYCTEERRKWDFNGKSCEPNYNTCQTFNSPDGKTVSYLENTLDYGTCNAGNAGCKWYCEDYDYAASAWTCGATVGAGNKLYLDRDAEECDVSAEGCHQFIRTKPGLGANLLSNSSFEDPFAGTIWDGLTQFDAGFDGFKSLSMATDLNEFIQVGPADYSVAGETYTLSFYAKDCGNSGNFGIDNISTSTLDTTADWQYYRISYVYPVDALGNLVNISITPNPTDPACLVDAIKLERGPGTQYSNYGTDGMSYLKLAPNYLSCDGVSDPAECDNFVRQCTKDEVGCEIYTPASGGMSIAAKVSAQDYCPAECIGYDTFIQKESTFDSLRDSYFIPKTAKTCSSSVVGCDEFTNLDEVAEGGEGKEYYKVLRQCIKPDASCAEFYTWEGSDETGYQLRVFQYQGDDDTDDAGAGYIGDPAITQDDSAECNVAIYNLPPSNPSYTADCRQFYNKSGGISYHLYSRTITCSDDCHPYRRTENNIAPNLTDPGVPGGTCVAGGDGSSQYLGTTAGQFNWDNVREVCYFCKNGGQWNVEQSACLYDAIPKQGQTCSASAAGCRDYVGNSGNNLATILMSNFNFTTQGWSEINGSVIGINPESIIMGADQNSLKVSNNNWEAFIKVDSLVEQGGTYVLSFNAKASSTPTNISAKFTNGAKEAVFSGLAPINDVDWNYYELNLINLDHQITSQESLFISAGSDYYIDDIKLSKVTDKYYLIKNSWKTPVSCDEDIFGNPWALYMLGCKQYRDRANETHYLHSFTQSCSDSAVGCELMIDTHNSNNYLANSYNVGMDAEENIPADSFAYIVYDKEKECSAEDKGCQRLGDTYKYESSILFGDAYLRNNPDKYEINGAPFILCNQGQEGCEEWKTSEGLSYFKDPGDQVCEWRQASGAITGAGWYKKKIKRCVDNSVCLKDSDCAAGTCNLESTDRPCATNPLMTFGYGGTGSIINQPTVDFNGRWTGICPAAQSGCGEYIDPISKFSENLIFNSDFSQNVDGDLLPDGWTDDSNGQQNVKLEPYTLYVLSATNNNTVTLNKDLLNNFFRLTDTNLLAPFPSNISLTAPAGQRASAIFYTDSGAAGNNIYLSVVDSSVGNGSKVELKKAIIDYQLAKELDKNSCNGIVDFEDGCVLFNERAQNGSLLANMTFDADLTYSDGKGLPPVAGVPVDRDSNIILKVSPDRVCDQWLACRSFAEIKDEKGQEKNTCYDIGLCDSVDENGDCDNFVLENKVNQETILPPADFSNFANASGYSKVGYDNPSTTFDMKGLYPLGEMEQKGEIANISNGNFEFVGANNYPMGWIYPGSGNWNNNIFTVIDNPVAAQTEGIGYAPEGRNFLKLGSNFSVESEYANVLPGTDYILTAYMNTINLADGDEQIIVEQYDGLGDVVGSLGVILSYARGGDWKFQLNSFKTDPGVFRIKVVATSTSNTVGNFYLDDVKITPALNSRDNLGVNWYTAQSCRLYPEDDSLSCQYFDDSGIIRKGWPGYCLEYDRYPGSANACLMWWPVDRIKGDGIEEGGGYADKFPLYYCTDAGGGVTNGDFYCDNNKCRAQDLADIPSRKCTCDPIFNNSMGLTSGVFLVAGQPEMSFGDGSSSGSTYKVSVQAADGKWYLVSTTGGAASINVTQGSGANQIPSNYFTGVEISCTGDCDFQGLKLKNKLTPPYCTTLSQTVTSMGQNKSWSGRVYQGSNFQFGCNLNTTKMPIPFTTTCNYSTDGPPFGSIVPPDLGTGPEEWDSDSKAGIQSLYYQLPTSNNPRMGQMQDVNNIKRLFAQSYGSWSWSAKTCQGGSLDGYACDDNGDCQDTCQSYCDSGIPGVLGGVCSATLDCAIYSEMNYSTGNLAQCVSSICDGGCKKNQACAVDADCQNLPNCFICGGAAGNSNMCALGGNLCVDNTDCSGTCGGAGTNKYYRIASQDWLAPADLCNGTGLPLRPDFTASNAAACLVSDFTNPLPSCDLCSILPIVSSVDVDNAGGSNVIFPKNKFVKLGFNTDIDSEQMPMVMYAVDWGDNEKTVVTGVEMRDKPDVNDPQTLYHLYSYWDLKAKQSVDQGQNTVYCGMASAGTLNWSGAPALGAPTCGPSSACCMIKPKVQIRDNWGWCNQGTEAVAGININACTQNQWEPFGGWVVVEEK